LTHPVYALYRERSCNGSALSVVSCSLFTLMRSAQYLSISSVFLIYCFGGAIYANKNVYIGGRKASKGWRKLREGWPFRSRGSAVAFPRIFFCKCRCRILHVAFTSRWTEMTAFLASWCTENVCRLSFGSRRGTKRHRNNLSHTHNNNMK